MKKRFIIILLLLPQLIVSQNKLEQSKEVKVYNEIISILCSCVKIDESNGLLIDDNCINQNKFLINNKIERNLEKSKQMNSNKSG